MIDDKEYGGTSRADYATDRARLDDFCVVESDWKELLYRLTQTNNNISCRNEDRKGTLSNLWADHVLTVLVEITCINAQAMHAEALLIKATEWVDRLENYIDKNWKVGQGDSSAVQTARWIKEQIENVLPNTDKSSTGLNGKETYYHMLRMVSNIRDHSDSYLKQIEDSGDMDGALSLLTVYLRNYGGVAGGFNSRFATLPEIYRRNILRTVPQRAVQDSTYIVVIPVKGRSGFTLPKVQSFPAGQNAARDDLIYRNLREEYISPMQCAEVNAVYITRKDDKVTGIRKQAINFQNTTTATVETLFTARHNKALPLGWIVESSMFVLNEGERKVCVSFRIASNTAESLASFYFPPDSFMLQLSDAEGWTEQPCFCRINMTGGEHWLCIEFTIKSDVIVLVPCDEETHAMVTEQPALRILCNDASCPYDWVSGLKFDTVEIQTEVTGIRNFTCYNELGQVDTSQPFYPFGIQAEKGTWFFFGNEEMGLKPLQEVRLKGIWKKLPETETEFDKIYKGYTASGKAIGSDAFLITTEWQQDGAWHTCADGTQHLFVPDNGEDRSLVRAEVVFSFMKRMSLTERVPYEYSRDRDGFFRVTLQSPSIGFGMAAYRNLFVETMVHNSHCKEKSYKELPSEPVIPMLADTELSYIASEKTTLADIENSSIRLSRITALSEQESFPISKGNEQLFLPTASEDHLLYFAFLHAQGEQNIRMYMDLVLPIEKVPFYNPQPDKRVKLSWEYWSGSEWKSIAIESISVEETFGLTQSGFVEIKLPEKVKESNIDRQGRMWLRGAISGDVSSCLAIRNVWTNCILLTAQNGNGSSLPADTIQAMREPNERVESVVQPLNGFGGKPVETEVETAVRQNSRIANRHRALMMKDYEQLVLEHFSEIDKVQCITIPKDNKASEICLVVFCSIEDSRYFLSPAWKLSEIQQLIRKYAPPFIALRVINPVYEQVEVHCKAVLWDSVQDKGKTIRQLVVLAQNYIAPWYRKGEIPELRKHFSYKELHARMVNHEDLMKLVILEVDGRSLPHVDIDTEDLIFKGNHPWSVLLPKIKIELLSPHGGINEAEIGSNFIIG